MQASQNQSFSTEEASSDTYHPLSGWRILAVDDDPDFQLALKFALEDEVLLGHPVELTQAFSRTEAIRVLSEAQEFAVILVDVVMESDDAGLQLVQEIREQFGLFSSRIILLTGQPGFAPVDSVMGSYDLSDYCLKSDINRRGIKNILSGALRAYRDISTLNFSKRCLETILSVSNQVAGNADIHEVADILLHQLTLMLSLNEGMMLHQDAAKSVIEIGEDVVPHGTDPEVIAAVGDLRELLNKKLSDLKDKDTRSALSSILSKNMKEMISKEGMFFSMSSELSFDRFVIYLRLNNQLNDTERMLVDVYLNSASQSLGNTKLINELSRRAYLDNALSIHNRNALLRDIQKVLDHQQSDISMLMLEVEGMHDIGSAFGSSHAKSMLIAVKDRLYEHFGSGVILARVYADQFFVLGKKELVNFDIVEGLFDKPVVVDGVSYLLQASYVLLPQVSGQKSSAEDVLRAVTTSMRAAQAKTRGQKVIHDISYERAAAFRFALSAGLSRALHMGQELRIEIQPKVDMRSEQVVGGEVLVRWRHDNHDISPVEFIPIAEKSTLIIELGQFVLKESLKVLQQLMVNQLPLRLSINVSPLELENSRFVDKLLLSCAMAKVPPSMLELEILESTIVEDMDMVSAQLEKFRAAGGQVAIDDFGTGMSTLSYMHLIPHDSLKIDRSFLNKITESTGKQALLKSIVSAAQDMDKKVLVEGVETSEQRDWLVANGCSVCQGWLYSPSLPVSGFIALAKMDQPFNT